MALLAAVVVGTTASAEGHLPEDLLQQVIADHYPALGRPPPATFGFYAVDLNGDGKADYMIEGGVPYCGSAGCSLWIYTKTPAGFRQIYDDIGVTSSTNLFPGSVMQTSTNGFRDLVFKDQPVAGGNYFQILVFDGHRYKEYEP